MQNPFRNRPQDDFGRRDHDEDRDRLRADDWRQNEARSWGGSGGYDRDEGYCGNANQGYDRNEAGRYGQGESAYAGRRSWQGSQDQGREYGRTRPAAYDMRDDLRGWADQSRSDAYEQANRQSQTQSASRYPRHSYTPGAQIWEDQDQGHRASRHDQRHHEFEPDYLHWRAQQMSNLDRDYATWRDERRQKFSSDFDNWRQTRAGKDAIPADNPKIGGITDGDAHSPVVKTKS